MPGYKYATPPDELFDITAQMSIDVPMGGRVSRPLAYRRNAMWLVILTAGSQISVLSHQTIWPFSRANLPLLDLRQNQV
jgi:hypothetical protein